VPLIGSVPIHPEISAGGDVGAPVALGEGELADIFGELARVIAEEVAPMIETAGCTARLLDQIASAVSAAPVADPSSV
jgi:hypothetical protein